MACIISEVNVIAPSLAGLSTNLPSENQVSECLSDLVSGGLKRSLPSSSSIADLETAEMEFTLRKKLRFKVDETIELLTSSASDQDFFAFLKDFETEISTEDRTKDKSWASSSILDLSDFMSSPTTDFFTNVLIMENETF